MYIKNLIIIHIIVLTKRVEPVDRWSSPQNGFCLWPSSTDSIQLYLVTVSGGRKCENMLGFGVTGSGSFSELGDPLNQGTKVANLVCPILKLAIRIFIKIS